MTPPDTTTTAIAITDITAERGRQLAKGRTAADDAVHSPTGQLVDAAVAYATASVSKWPYRTDIGEKLARLDRRSRLIRAAALLVAEVERIDYNEKVRNVSVP